MIPSSSLYIALLAAAVSATQAAAQSPDDADVQILNFIEATAIRSELSEARVIQTCFLSQRKKGDRSSRVGSLVCALRASNNPGSKDVDEPASFAYTLDNDGPDSFSIDSAFRAQTDIGFAFLGAGVQWNKSNQRSSPSDNLNLGLSLDFDYFQPVGDYRGTADDFFSVRSSIRVAYNRKAIFGDSTLPTCVPAPAPAFCSRQNFDTLRVIADAVPFLRKFQRAGDGRAWAFEFSPTVGFFYDAALDDGVLNPDGSQIQGSVAGVRAAAGLLVAPDLLGDAPISLRLHGQIIEAIHRSPLRRADFENSSRLFSAALEYLLVPRDRTTGFIPAIAITYTNGSDSLQGERSQDTVVLGFKLKY